MTGEVKLNYIHVANAMNKLVKAAKRGTGERSWKLEGNRLTRDPRFAQLIDLVRAQCPSFLARQGASVLNALAVLHADLGAAAVDEKLAAQLGELVERKARDMNPQDSANTLNALCKIEAAVAAVSPAGWAGLAEAAKRTASEMKPQEVANSLNKLEAAAAAVSPAGWAGLAQAAERTAREMNEQGIANSLNALSQLEAVAAAVSPSGWAALAQAAERTASEMKPQNVRHTLNALGKLEAAAAAVSPAGWVGLAQAAVRTAPEMDPQNIANSLNALGKLEAVAAAMLPAGWPGGGSGEDGARDERAEHFQHVYALGVLPAAASALSPSARKELEAAAEREAPNMTSEGRRMTLRGCENLKLSTPSAFLK